MTVFNVWVPNVRARRLLPAAAASVVLLTGCGVQGLQWHPGIAATVGDQTITDQRIDDLAAGFCSAIKPQLKSNDEVAPLSVLKSSIVQGLVTRAAVEQVGATYHVGPDDAYRTAVAQAQSQATTLSSGAADAYVLLQSLTAYLSSVAEAVGEKILAGEGQTGATSEQTSAAGQKVVARWISTHHVEISPAYDAVVESDGKVTSADTDVSYPVSSSAKDGYAWLTSSSPDKDYAAALPVDQSCG